MATLLIKNGHVVCPDTKTDRVADLGVRDGVITEIGAGLDAAAYEAVIDATGLVVAPGLVDVHVHFRDPGLTYKEDIETGTQAAKRGGFTTVIPMANTKPVVDSAETLAYVYEKGLTTGIRVLPAATITKGMAGQELVDMKALAQAGAVGFTDDGLPITDEALVIAAMKEAAALDMPLSFHEELPAFIQNPGVNHGPVAEQLGLHGAEAAAEYTMIGRDVMLALATGATIDIQHISSAEGVALVRAAKAMGAKVHAEATPHHFTLTQDAVLQHGTLAKMNPPLRAESDRQAIIAGLADGTIDLIATDHAPHSAEEKAKPFTQAPSGITGLETSLALGITSLVKPGYLTLSQLLEKMTINPLRLYHLDGGRLAVGERADLVLFDENETWVFDHSVSKAANTPFLGAELTGKVKYTICQGQVVYRDEGVCDER